jgi:hypothetical protein
VTDPDRDSTRPIRCVACGRDFVSPQWFGAQGPLCATCHERMRRAEDVSLVDPKAGGSPLLAWLKRLLGG